MSLFLPKTIFLLLCASLLSSCGLGLRKFVPGAATAGNNAANILTSSPTPTPTPAPETGPGEGTGGGETGGGAGGGGETGGEAGGSGGGGETEGSGGGGVGTGGSGGGESGGGGGAAGGGLTGGSGGPFVYVLSEPSRSIKVYSANTTNGSFTTVQNFVDTTHLPGAFKMVLSPSAHCVIVSTTTTLQTYAANEIGSLSQVQSLATMVPTTAMTVSPNGRFLYTVSQTANVLVSYLLDEPNCTLSAGGTFETYHYPVEIFVEAGGLYLQVITQAPMLELFRIDPVSGLPTHVTGYGTQSPYSFAVHPSSGRLYLSEGSGFLGCFERNAEALREVTPPMTITRNYTSMVIDDSNNLYGVNRNESTVELRHIIADGNTVYAYSLSTETPGPRDIIMDSEAKILIVSHPEASSLEVIRINRAMDRLEGLNTVHVGTNPTAIVMTRTRN